jgi:hypothetical protein
MPSPRINVRLPEAVYQRLQEEAARRGCSPSQVAQQALTAYLAGASTALAPARETPGPDSWIPLSADGACPAPPARRCDGTTPPRVAGPAQGPWTMTTVLQRIAARQAQCQAEAPAC